MLPDEKMRWTFKLLSKSNRKYASSDPLAVPAKESGSKTVSQLCNTVPNLYHDLDFNSTYYELLKWLSASEKVTSLLMAVEAVCTWNIHRCFVIKKSCFVNTTVLSEKLSDLIKLRCWSLLPQQFYSWYLALYGQGQQTQSLSQFCVSSEDKSSYCIIDCVDVCRKPLTLLSKESKLIFHFNHPSVTSCNLPGECGFILKTVPSESALWSMRLCTKKEDYINESVHFHNEILAEKMHVYFDKKYNNDSYLFPLSWLFWLSFNTNAYETDEMIRQRNTLESKFIFRSGSRFKVLYSF